MCNSDECLEVFASTRVHPCRDVKAVFVSARAGCSIEDVFDNRGFDFGDFPYLVFSNGSAFVRCRKRDAAFFAGLQLVPLSDKFGEIGGNRDSDYFMVFSVLRGRPHGKALNLLPNNFSSLFIKLSSPHGLPVIEHFFMFFIICSSSFSRKYFNQSFISSSK